MLFNSLEFILFLPVVLAVFFLIQHRFRLFVLLIASYYFYMSWNPAYIALIVVATLTSFFAGSLLSTTQNKINRNLILFGGIAINLGLLVYFKYANFILENVNRVASMAVEGYTPIELLDILLPVGISFYTFQTMSYVIDVYHRKIPAESNVGFFALYVCFFPQLVAGPIERYADLAPQFKIPSTLNKTNLSHGARLILYGFFMKMVIADNIASIIDPVYLDIENTHSVTLIITAVLYAFQIYCDFHGYSTIAIGVARLFNINLSANFRAPYIAFSLTDFWRKWHITLTNWFRDYVYYPMGGNRQGRLKWMVAILVVFITSGIWHGAKWTFLIWGALHGIIVLLEKILKLDKKSRFGLLNVLRMFVVFAMVTLLWVFFRSPSIAVAKLFYARIVSNWHLEMSLPALEICILLALFVIVDVFTRKSDFATVLDKFPFAVRWGIYFVLVFLIMGRSGTDLQPFIYFRF